MTRRIIIALKLMIKHCLFLQHRFSVTYGGGLFVAVSYDGFPSQVQTSSDGLTWATQTSAADNFWFSVTWGNNTFVAVTSSGDGDRVMVSSPSMPHNFRTHSPSPAPTIAPTLSPTNWLAACDNPSWWCAWCVCAAWSSWASIRTAYNTTATPSLQRALKTISRAQV